MSDTKSKPGLPATSTRHPAIRAMLISGLFKSLDEAAVLIERMLYGGEAEREKFAAAARRKADAAVQEWEGRIAQRNGRWRGKPSDYPIYVIAHAQRMRKRLPRLGYTRIAAELTEFYGLEKPLPASTVRTWCEDLPEI